MPDLTQRPTNEFLDQTFNYFHEMWSTTHAKWRKVDSYYHRTYSVWGDSETLSKRESYRPSTPTNTIDHAADTQLAFEPRVHREPVGDTESHKADADTVEKRLIEIMNDSALWEPSLTWKVVGRQLLQYGWTVPEGPVLDMASRPKRPKPFSDEDNEDLEARMLLWRAEMKSWNPIRIRGIHPARVLLDPMEKKPSVVVRMGQLPAYKVREMSVEKKKTRRFSQVFQRDNYDPYEKIYTLDYWTLQWHAFAVKGRQSGSNAGTEILWAERNTWGFVPYDHAFSGFGSEPTDLQEFDPSFLAQGLLDPIMESIKLQAQRMSAQHTLLMRRAYARLGTRSDTFELMQQMARDGILQGDDGDLWIEPTPDMDRSMFEIGREVDADIVAGSFTRDLSGQRQSGISTVGQQHILSQAAQRKFQGPAIQLQHLASIKASRILQLIDVMSLNLEDFGGILGLKPSHIHHHYPVKVTFEVIDPVLQLQRREMGLREVELGVKDKLSYWEMDERVEDTTQRQDRLLRQMVREHPGVLAQLGIVAAREIGLEAEFQATAEEEQEAAAQDGRRSTSFGNGTSESVSRNLREPLTDDVAKPERIEE